MPVLQGNIYITDYSTDLIKLSCENPTGWFTDYYLIKNRTVLVYTDYWNQSGWLGLKADDDTIYEFVYGQVVLPTSTSENDLTNQLINWIYNITGLGGGTVTSVDLAVPSPVNPAFSVSGNPVTTTGTLAINALGTAADYVRGDGSLAPFPTGTTDDPFPKILMLMGG